HGDEAPVRDACNGRVISPSESTVTTVDRGLERVTDGSHVGVASACRGTPVLPWCVVECPLPRVIDCHHDDRLDFSAPDQVLADAIDVHSPLLIEDPLTVVDVEDGVVPAGGL